LGAAVAGKTGHLYPALRAISNKNTNLECHIGHGEEAECDMLLNASDGMIFRNSHFCKAERMISTETRSH
jgi:hypothetical protein